MLALGRDLSIITIGDIQSVALGLHSPIKEECMKKLSMLAIVGMFVAMPGGFALAAGTPDTGPGCGLGKLAFQN